MAPILGILASSITGGLVTDLGAMFPIQSYVVPSGGTASFTFSSIPSTYSHLQLRVLSKSTTAGQTNIAIRFNSDTGNNYAWHQLYGDGASAAASAATSTNLIRCIHSSNDSNVFGAGVIDVLDYANSNKYKTTRTLSGYDMNGSGGYIMLRSGVWMSTSAISSLTVVPESGNLAQYTSLALFGVKA